jgi:electron transfer flavoprotein alpha subunit
VDLSQAEWIVAGLRHQGAGHVALADARQSVPAPTAASRPICDNGWLPIRRQIWQFGQTVAPRTWRLASRAPSSTSRHEGVAPIVVINMTRKR